MTALLENHLADVLSIDGEWQIEIAGNTGTVAVPGVWEVQGYPKDVERAVYRRSFDAPAEWADRRVFLRFGAVSYDVEVFMNDQRVGRHEGLWTPFEFDVTDALRFGESNRVELQIIKPLGDNDTYPYREVLVGFIPYVATTFGGPWQSVELVAHQNPALRIEQLSADWQTGEVSLHAGVAALSVGALDELRVVLELTDRSGAVVASTESAASPELALRLIVDNPALWSPDSPALYDLRLRLKQGDSIVAETGRLFGFRALDAEGALLLLNGQPANLRGILSWGWDPATLAPTPSDEAIRDEFRRVRALGFNLVKLCLFVPPQRVFEIADEEGMLLWLELPFWWQRLTEHLRQQTRIEYADILRAVHYHPSIIIYSLGCELEADMADASLLSSLNTLARDATCGVLVCDNSGSGEAYQGLNFDYADFADYHFYCDLHYFVPLLDHFRRDWRPPRPWIFGEFCDKDTYRDLAQLPDGGENPWWRDVLGVEGALKRWAYSVQTERMDAHQLPFSDSQIKRASDLEAFDVRKVIVERARARDDIGGYVITGLRDTLASTSGVFDDAGRSKFDPDAFRQFNSDNVLLLDQGRTRRWTHGGDRPFPLDLFNHVGGASVTFRVLLSHITLPQQTMTLRWRLMDFAGEVIASSSLPVAMLPAPGQPREIGAIDLVLPERNQPEQCTLEIELEGYIRNEWPLWIYPPVDPNWQGVRAYDPVGAFGGLWPFHDMNGSTGVVIASLFDSTMQDYVRRGGRAILLQPQAGMLPTQAVPFWRESIKLLYDHPVLQAFPHQGYASLQFYHLATDHAFDTAAFEMGKVMTPVIRRLDARVFKVLDYLVEIEYGAGRMFASTLRFFGGAGDQVHGLLPNPAGVWLLRQMINVLANEAAE